MSRTRLALPVLDLDEPCHECGDTAGQFIVSHHKHDLYECDTCTAHYFVPAGS